jgi:hypothetical protein
MLENTWNHFHPHVQRRGVTDSIETAIKNPETLIGYDGSIFPASETQLRLTAQFA